MRTAGPSRSSIPGVPGHARGTRERDWGRTLRSAAAPLCLAGWTTRDEVDSPPDMAVSRRNRLSLGFLVATSRRRDVLTARRGRVGTSRRERGPPNWRIWGPSSRSRLRGTPGPRPAALADLDAEPLTDTRARVPDVLPIHRGHATWVLEKQSDPAVTFRQRPKPGVDDHGRRLDGHCAAVAWSARARSSSTVRPCRRADRRLASDVPPQIPCSSLRASAAARHGRRTMHPALRCQRGRRSSSRKRPSSSSRLYGSTMGARSRARCSTATTRAGSAPLGTLRGENHRAARRTNSRAANRRRRRPTSPPAPGR